MKLFAKKGDLKIKILTKMSSKMFRKTGQSSQGGK